MAVGTIIKTLIGAAVGLLIGVVLVNPIADQATVNATLTNISASGQTLMKLVPTLFIVGLMVVVVNMVI